MWERCRKRRQDDPLRVLDGKGFSDFDERADGAERRRKMSWWGFEALKED